MISVLLAACLLPGSQQGSAYAQYADPVGHAGASHWMKADKLTEVDPLFAKHRKYITDKVAWLKTGAQQDQFLRELAAALEESRQNRLHRFRLAVACWSMKDAYRRVDLDISILAQLREWRGQADPEYVRIAYLIHYLEDSWNEMRGLGKRLLQHFPDDADLQQAYLGEVRALVRDRAEVKASNQYADRMVQLKRWTPTQRQSHEADMQIRLYMRYKTESDRQNAISAC